MSLFGTKPPQTDPKIEELTEEIRNLSVQVAQLKGEKDGLKGVRALEAERQQLQETIERLKIEKGRADEENARKVRDAEHTAGLHRKQSEWEARKASEEAVLKVKEENLSKDQKRFEDQMAFHQDQIANEVTRLDGILQALMARLPEITIEKSITQTQKG